MCKVLFTPLFANVTLGKASYSVNPGSRNSSCLLMDLQSHCRGVGAELKKICR